MITKFLPDDALWLSIDPDVRLRVAKCETATWIFFDHPETKNSMSLDTIMFLYKYISDIDEFDDDEFRPVIISGIGDTFCSGFDLNIIKEAKNNYDKAQIKMISEAGELLINMIKKARVPIISLLNGPAVGGGAEIALATDYRVGLNSTFISFPEISHGFVPGFFGIELLRDSIGSAATRQLLLTEGTLDGNKLNELGLVASSFQSITLLYDFIEKILEKLKSTFNPKTWIMLKHSINGITNDSNSKRFVDSIFESSNS